MKRIKRGTAMKRGTEMRARRYWWNYTVAGFLKIGSSPMPPWISFLLALIVTVSAFDDVRMFIQPGPHDALEWWVLASTGTYWISWMALAYRPQWVPLAFVLLLVTMYPQAQPGGPLLLAFGTLAAAAYRVSTRGLAAIAAAFLVWQVAWAAGVSELGVQVLWGYIPATVLLIMPGLAVKLQREKALNVARAQKMAEETTYRAAQEQRAALARELHDVVTHGLTMIAVQANLGTISKTSPEQHAALTEIGSMARSSLDDLRRLLQTMRADEQLTSSEVETRVALSSATINLTQSVAETQSRLNGLGFPTQVTTSGDLDRTPNGLRSTVVRILQESSTNVAKHSGAGTECDVALNVREDHLELTIRNRLTPGRPRLPVSGTGLVGLRERTSRLGGTLEAGGSHGWWTVRAVLPFKGRQRLG